MHGKILYSLEIKQFDIIFQRGVRTRDLLGYFGPRGSAQTQYVEPRLKQHCLNVFCLLAVDDFIRMSLVISDLSNHLVPD